MKGFLLSLQSEFYKSRKTLGFWCAVVLPLLIVALLFIAFYSNSAKFEKLPPQMLWIQYSFAILGIMGTLLLPIYIVFVTYSVNSVEHKADTWKTLFSLPISKWAIYSSKYLYAMFLVALCLALFASFTVCSGLLLSVLKPALRFSSYSFASPLFQIYTKLFLASQGILAIQFLLSLLWKDFLKPMGIGFAGTIIGVIMAVNKWEYAYLFPYAHPALALSLGSSSGKKAKTAAFALEYFTKDVVAGLIIAAVVFIIGFFIVQKRSVK
ncbi:ABC transporter permease [Mucilaginibacter sp.]